MNAKYKSLLRYLKNLHSVAVAYSGGVDSSFLLAASVEALGDKVVGVIGRSPTYPKREMDDAVMLAQKIGARIEFIDTDELSKPTFNTNPPTRCFECKSTLFSGVWHVAKGRGIAHVLEGSNADDVGDFRPGMDASKQLNVKSPLVDLDFTKKEIRQLLKQMDLPTWNKPSFACLSSRIPYGQTITVEKLTRIEKAEYALRDLGFNQLRVRDYSDLCRIEIPAEHIEEISQSVVRTKVVGALKEAGYNFICLDLEGYRSGSMNETLSDSQKNNARK